MTHYLKNGNIFNVTRDAAIDIRDTLPVGTYAVKFNPFDSQFFLEAVTPFKAAGKLYGDVLENAERILNTFHERPNQTGVLLSGVAGTGKTMLARVLSTQAAEQGIPTLMVNDKLFGEGFNAFMQTIEQPAVVIFDEFEKVYDKDEQAALLTLFDGVYQSKKLFIVTANDKYRINNHMINRPGRIFYNIEYNGLDTAFVFEYCEANLHDTSHTAKVVSFSTLFESFSFDMLKALIEEMNRYGEGPEKASRILNAKPQDRTSSIYNVTILEDGVPLRDGQYDPSRTMENPLVVEHHLCNRFDSDADDVWGIEFTRADMTDMDVVEGVAEFRTSAHGHDYVIQFQRRVQKSANGASYWDFL